MTKPNFLGLGAQKCASTWIHQVLSDHPEVFVSTPKEIDFFTHYFNRGYCWYEDHFSASSSALAIGEISPSYFCEVSTPERVHRYAPEMKMVLSLRDPVRRAFSNHLHEIRKGHLRNGDLSFEAGHASNPMYLEQSRYGTHLENWRRYFPADQFLILVQEEIHAAPQSQAERLFDFLGIDTSFRSESAATRSHETVGVKSPTLFKAWRTIGDAGRDAGMGGLVKMVKRFPPVRAAMDANKRDLKQEIPPMKRETENDIRRQLAPEIEKLSDLTGRRDWPWPGWEKEQRNHAN